MQRPGRLRFGRWAVRTSRTALLAVFVAATVTAPAISAPQALPTESTPMTISYQGSFDLTNTMIPSGVQHSFVYHVVWAYSWSGTWGDLFPGASLDSNQTSFLESGISGSLHATWRAIPDGPQLACTLRIVPDMGDFPDFRATYDPTRGIVRIAGLEAPTERYGRYSSNSNPMCGGGPQIDIFGPPASWKPLGDGGGALSLRTGGVHRYDRTWTWGHSFGKGLRRSYVSAIRSSLEVRFAGASG